MKGEEDVNKVMREWVKLNIEYIENQLATLRKIAELKRKYPRTFKKLARLSNEDLLYLINNLDNEEKSLFFNYLVYHLTTINKMGRFVRYDYEDMLKICDEIENILKRFKKERNEVEKSKMEVEK